MGIFDLGGPTFGLKDCKVATNNLNGTFGTALDVPSVQVLGVNLQTVNAMLEGDDEITAVQARAISGEVSLRFGGIDLRVLAILTGETQSSSGSTPNQSKRMLFDGAPTFPYFAVCGRADAAEASGADTHVFIPKVKITTGFELRMEYSAFSIPEVTAMAVRDPDYNAIFEVIEHETAAVVAIPPV